MVWGWTMSSRLQCLSIPCLGILLLLAPTGASARPSGSSATGPGHLGLPADTSFPAAQGREAWTWTGGPKGGAILSLINTPLGSLLAGLDSGGLYRSVDGGQSWQEADPSFSWPCCNYTVPALAASGRAVYAGTWGGGVYRSDDDGQSWYATAAIPGDGYPIVRALAVCHYGEQLFAGGSFGVARSDDGGASWETDADGLPTGWVKGLALRGTTLYAQLDNGIYRRDPAAGAWSLFIDGLWASYGQQSLTTTAETLFLSTHEGGVFHLDCEDAEWIAMNDGLGDDNVDVVLEVDQSLYAGLMGGAVLRWDQAQQLWIWIGDGLWNADVRAMAGRGSTPFAGTYGAGVFGLDGAAGTWTWLGEGMSAPFVRDIVSDGAVLYAGLFGGGIALSFDEGGSWSRAEPGPANVYVLELAFDGNAVYAGTWNGVCKSSDQGQSWPEVGLQSEGIFALELLASQLYAGTFDGQVWTSADGAQTWDQVGDGLPSAPVNDLALLGTTLYAALGGEGVYALPAGEPAWTAINENLPDLDCLTLAVHGGTLHVGLANSGVWQWHAGESNWIGTGLTSGPIFSLESVGSKLMAGGWGFLRSNEDGGEAWLDEADGLKPWLAVQVIAPADDWTFVGLDGGGVWRRAATTAVDPIDPAAGPGATRLQVQPNPFTRGAHISFSLARPGLVDLAVYDVSGRRVVRLAAGTLPAGLQELSWDGRLDGGAPAAAGVYLLRLQAEGRELVSKSILLR